ncbi:hypothetical protein PAXINDRAFT_115993 [Paxillus involutus ATCC 200175]|uniref:Uncharacterized protein n=1 Tax=Paxillus involutus ATCC 200175 TaxID=664439 RepID=A0A0C9U580_PAXIN|nr:hypothetical protein PAXINDRAFT_115993 [Paxillus involutus ATCC 200175]
MAQTLGQMYLTCAWLEAIFYGTSCILFGFCIFVLGTNTSSSRRVLLAAIVQFALATTHVIITLIELFQAFTYSVDANDYYSNPGGNNIFIAGSFVYIVNTFVQELLLIWRLYVLWGGKLRVCILPLILLTLHVIIACIAVSSFIPSTATSSSHNAYSYGLAGWGLETATNLTTNCGIAYRLWGADKRTALLRSQKHFKYKNSMLIVIECGALITTCTIIMFGLYASGHDSGIVGVGIATQVATTAPLFIVARVGITQSRSRAGSTSQTTYTVPLEINVMQTENTFNDYPMQTTTSKDPGARWAEV